MHVWAANPRFQCGSRDELPFLIAYYLLDCETEAMGVNSKEQRGGVRGSMFGFLGELFARLAVQPVLVGGYAVNAYHVQRNTFDIDFMVDAEDCRRIERALVEAGYAVFSRQDAFLQMRCDRVGMRDIDLLITDPGTRDTLLAEGTEVSIAGQVFTVPSVLHLVAMKLNSIAGNEKREMKDLPDIVGLLREARISPVSDEVRSLFARYSLEGLHERVVQLVEEKQ